MSVAVNGPHSCRFRVTDTFASRKPFNTRHPPEQMQVFFWPEAGNRSSLPLCLPGERVDDFCLDERMARGRHTRSNECPRRRRKTRRVAYRGARARSRISVPFPRGRNIGSFRLARTLVLAGVEEVGDRGFLHLVRGGRGFVPPLCAAPLVGGRGRCIILVSLKL